MQQLGISLVIDNALETVAQAVCDIGNSVLFSTEEQLSKGQRDND